MSDFITNLRNLLNKNPFKEKYKINRLRPPGAAREKEFMERCIRCARSIAVCPYKSIERAGSADGIQVGTPYIYPEKKACYMCMLCTAVCPTGALDKAVTLPEEADMGIAVLNQDSCLNYIYADQESEGTSDGAALLCNTCINVCPFPSKALYLEDHIKPVVTDYCTGCGICTERCPEEPRAIFVIPKGMADPSRSGLYYLRNRRNSSEQSGDVLHGKALLREKEGISSKDVSFDFIYDFNTENKIEGWD